MPGLRPTAGYPGDSARFLADARDAAARLGRAEREKVLSKFEEDLKALKKEVMEQGNLANRVQLLFSKDKPKEIGKAIGNVLVGLLVPAVRKVQSAYDRSEQVQRNLRVAFALAAYRADHRRYPARLDDLAPKYLAAVPGDLFSDQARRWR